MFVSSGRTGVIGKLERAKSTVFGLVASGALGVFVALSGLATPSHAQALATLCPRGGFDICFPNLEAGAPAAACSASEADAGDISGCLGQVCSGVAAEPEPGFFSYCCAQGGSVKYDDFCVFVVESACGAVADHCVDRCPPLALLLGAATLAPPPAVCIGSYPSFIAEVCSADKFCCTTSWDSLCAGEALEARDR